MDHLSNRRKKRYVTKKIQDKKHERNEDTILFKNDKAALLFDAYTHSYFRGNGYHNYMIKWRLNELKHNKIEKAYTIVFSYNKPSMVNQRKCRFDIDQIFYVFKIGSKIYLSKYSNK